MWVLTAVLALLFLLLCSPLRLRFTLFEGSAALEIRLLFFRFHIPPKNHKREKPQKVKKNAAKKEPGPQKRKKKKAGPLSGPWNTERLYAALTLVKELLLSCGRAGAFLLKKTRLERLWVEIMVVRQDACQTAAESGKLNAWFYGVLSFLENYIRPEDLYLNIYPGFWAAREKTAAEAIVSFTPARLLGAGCLLLYGGLRSFFRFTRPPQNKAGRSPAASSGSERAAVGSNHIKEGM